MPKNCNCIRLGRLQHVVKSTEQVQESITSLRQWLSDVDERLISRVVYQRANSDEIDRHLTEQDVSALMSHLLCFVSWYDWHPTVDGTSAACQCRLLDHAIADSGSVSLSNHLSSTPTWFKILKCIWHHMIERCFWFLDAIFRARQFRFHPEWVC